MADNQGEFFEPIREESKATAHRPLAARMRPRGLEEVVGQDHITGPEGLLRRLVSTDTLGSILLYGPPGSGKTSIAEAIATQLKSRFHRINAVLSNTAELRDVLRLARNRPEDRTLLFIDEIHRFNKAQQDLLLPDVESGGVRLIGATTHNPGFYVIPPLLSRSHLFKLEPVSVEAIVSVLRQAIEDSDRGIGSREMVAKDSTLEKLARICDGDLRRALNSLETISLALPLKSELDDEALESFARDRFVRYDSGEDEHYDTISAYIKSMRGSDSDAAVYWLAKMLEGGEDPRFIARRLIIFASEDVGLADSRALSLATATLQACEFVGLPECQLNLSHCTLFMATAPKSNSATMAIGKARNSIKNDGLQPIPMHLRDAHTKFNRSLGQGKGYEYSHEFEGGISAQNFMDKPIPLYKPSDQGAELKIKERIASGRKLKEKLRRKN